MWDNDILPLFGCEAVTFIQTIKWSDQLPRRGLLMTVMSLEYYEGLEKLRMKELTEDEFKQRLRDAGWSEQDIEDHWKEIMEDDESGYDGP